MEAFAEHGFCSKRLIEMFGATECTPVLLCKLTVRNFNQDF